MVAVRDLLLFVSLVLAIVNLQVTQQWLGINQNNNIAEENDHFHGKRSLQAIPVPAIEDDLAAAKGMIQSLAQVIMKLQSSIEQRTRFEGNSGITEARGYGSGTQAYHSSTHNTLNIHDHADTIDTMGMGEFSAVLNGVEFTTRHNDYLLAKPGPLGGASNYHRTVPIEHPPVPPSVLSKATVPEQIVEMREYFRAFQKQNVSIRDYRPYFKANLCYLEATWIKSSTTIEEPFRSDRHAIDAATWKVLNEKYRFLMNNGQKNNLENLPWLPTSLRDLVDREAFDFSINGAAPTAFVSDKSNPRPLSGGWAKPAETSDEIYVTLSSRVEGIFLTVRNNFGVAGSFSSSVGCNNRSDGCLFTPKPACPVGSPCPWSTANLNGTQTVSWMAGALGSVTYGPLTACFDISVTVNASGSTKVLFIRSPTANTTMMAGRPVRITGCIYPAEPVIANWEYRILCAPIQGDLPTNRFRPFEDNAALLREKKNMTTITSSRRCLFELNPYNKSVFSDSSTTIEFIDDIMATIPGKDNYAANLTDDSFGSMTLDYRTGKVLNVGYYSRFFALSENDAMGRSQRRRGFNDPTLWAAMTSQDKVCGLSVYDDVALIQRHQKWSYALPIEVVYMTPLSSWNPYNLYTHPKNASSAQQATVTQGGRDGSLTREKAYNQTSHNKFFRTPVDFFSGALGETDPADTSSAGAKGVIDSDGNLRAVMASGHYIIMPDIAGVGLVRQRYPIFPLSSTKELAYKEMKAYEIMKPSIKRTGPVAESVGLFTSFSRGEIALHQHELNLGPFEIAQLDAGQSVLVDSDLAAGHTHSVKVSRKKVGDNFVYTMEECDEILPCWDKHDRICLTPNCPNAIPEPPMAPVPVPVPEVVPTTVPTTSPAVPTTAPAVPTTAPAVPTTAPAAPTTAPAAPTTAPAAPTTAPAAIPTMEPVAVPASMPSAVPESIPSTVPATMPVSIPSSVPSSASTGRPPMAPPRSRDEESNDNPIGVGGAIGVAVAVLSAILLGMTVGYLAFVNFYAATTETI